MNDFIIPAPAHLVNELKEVADALGVSVDALVAYFFAREVVHT